MNFLNPAILYGLFAAVLPLVIHLLSRRRAKNVPFPSIVLLERMKTDRMRRLRLKQLILILLRTLIILAVVLAFARPTVNGSFSSGARTSAVIVIDGSASMGYVHNGELLSDTAVRAARSILDMLDGSGATGIIMASDRTDILPPGMTADKNALLAALGEAVTFPGGCDATSALGAAFDMLDRTADPNKEVYFITDGAAGSLPDSLPPADARTRLYTVLVGPERRSGPVITNVSLNDRLVTPGKAVEFSVEGVPDPESDNMTIELFVEGDRKARATVNRRADNRASAGFSYTPDTPGWFSVSALSGDKRFEAGETRRMVLHVPEQANVLLTGGTQDDIYYLQKALDPDPDRSMFRMTVAVGASSITREQIADADIVVLSGIESLQQDVYRSLVTAIVERGAGLVVFPPRVMDSALYANGIFRDLFPAVVEGRTDIDAQGASPAVIDRFQMSHPVLRGISRDGDFAKPRVRSFVRLRPTGAAGTIARFTDGAFAAGDAVCGRGRVVVFAVDAAGNSGDMPMTGIFTPMFIRIVQYLTGTGTVGGHYETGDVVEERIGDIPDGAGVFVKPSDGPMRSVAYTVGDSGALLSGVTAERPGFYSVFVGNSERTRYSVDIPYGEVVFERAGSERVERAYNGVRWKTLDASADLADMVSKERYGTELFGLLMIAALILLAVEMVVSRKA